MSSIAELLLLHHSHTDIGYTHPQPILWRLHSRFIDQALDLCEQTADAPEPSRVRWTCEVSSPVLRWLEQAPARQIERFQALVAARQIAVGAMPYNITPLMGADQILETLRPVKRLRDEFGVPVRVAINHDVNGLPWPIVGCLRDAGIDLLLMGLNITFGAFPLRRPRAFRWEGPDGRDLPVWHGEHYNTVAHVFKIGQASTQVMAEGWNAYEQRLLLGGYPHDFAFFTATHHDFFDNNPPDPLLARMVRQWNDEGRVPAIRFVTPEMLLDRLASLAPGSLPVHKGDWTDHWNFGCGSTGAVTRISRQAKNRLRTVEWLAAASPLPRPARHGEDAARAWRHLHLFDEHTWGHHSSIADAARDEVAAGADLKDGEAYAGWALSRWLLRDWLELAAGNPALGAGLSGLLLVNPSPERRVEYPQIPADWRQPKMPYDVSRAHALDEALEADGRNPAPGPAFQAVTLEPYSVQFLPAARWQEAPKPNPKCSMSDQAIESPFYRLGFDRAGGRVTGLYDKVLGREILDLSSPWSFFGLVQETVDLKDEKGLRPELMGRDAFFKVVPDDIFEGRTGWTKKWIARHLRPDAPTECAVVPRADGVALRLAWDRAPGVERLVLEIKLLAEHPEIHCEARFLKPDIRWPDGTYFTFPLALKPWRAHFDTADLPVEFEAEQLPGSSTDFITAGSWVSVHQTGLCATLACPDAPMVQLGGFRFGRFTPADRNGNCLLLGWPLNNYWDTNFRVSQPGFHRYRYRLTTSASFDPVRASRFAAAAHRPVEMHPVVLQEARLAPGPLVHLDEPSLQLLSLRREEPQGQLWARLANVADGAREGRLSLPSFRLGRAWRCDAFGERQEELPVAANAVVVPAKAREIVSLLLTPLA